MQYVNDFQKHSRLLQLLLLDRAYSLPISGL